VQFVAGDQSKAWRRFFGRTVGHEVGESEEVLSSASTKRGRIHDLGGGNHSKDVGFHVSGGAVKLLMNLFPKSAEMV
jgi:hypothetical protein